MKLDLFFNLFKKSSAKISEAPLEAIKSNMLSDKDGFTSLIDSGKIKASELKYDEAIDDFTKAIVLDPANIYVYLERSKARREIKDKAGADKDLDTFKRLYENLDNGLKANDEGDEYFNSGDFKNAIRSYNKAIQLIPTVTSIYYYRGYSKQSLKDFKGAIEDFDSSIQTNSSNKQFAYLERSKLKSIILVDEEGALSDINKAIELDPNYAEFYYHRAKLLGDYDGLQDLNKAVELEPNIADNYIARSFKRKSMNDLEGCISDINMYIELSSDYNLLTLSEAYSLRAGIRLCQNDFEAALIDYNKAADADNSNHQAYYDRGLVKFILRDNSGAILDFDRAIELHPNYSDAYYQRGIVKQNSNLEEDGEKDIIKAKNLGYSESN